MTGVRGNDEVYAAFMWVSGMVHDVWYGGRMQDRWYRVESDLLEIQRGCDSYKGSTEPTKDVRK